MTRTIKHEEKTGNLAGARSLLARLKHAPGIEKVWRTVLEGALFEARSGNPTVARRLLKCEYFFSFVPYPGMNTLVRIHLSDFCLIALPPYLHPFIHVQT